MKKELIVQGMGWGHMPRYLIEDNLRDGSLRQISGRHFKGGKADLVAARRRDTPHGPIANRLWQFIADEAAKIIPASG
jgi:DNA-binding transcriptional LysR family regulator